MPDIMDLIAEILDNPKLKNVASKIQSEYHDEPILRTAAQMARRLLVNKACTGLLDEFGLYRWDDKAALLGVEKPVKENDHAMDALRYFVNSLPDWRFEHVKA